MRIAWPGQLSHLMEAASGPNQCLFTAVMVGIVETAFETARRQVARRRDALRAYERVEGTRAEQEGWLVQQAYEGMLRAVEENQEGSIVRSAELLAQGPLVLNFYRGMW
jgi:hypothetical protein